MNKSRRYEALVKHIEESKVYFKFERPSTYIPYPQDALKVTPEYLAGHLGAKAVSHKNKALNSVEVYQRVVQLAKEGKNDKETAEILSKELESEVTQGNIQSIWSNIVNKVHRTILSVARNGMKDSEALNAVSNKNNLHKECNTALKAMREKFEALNIEGYTFTINGKEYKIIAV